MTSLDTTLTTVQQWFAARGSADPAAGLRKALADEAVLEFAGRRVVGADAVVARTLEMPSGPAGAMEWTVLPGAQPQQVTIRGTGVGGAPMRSPGGPMSAMDFAFSLDASGLITKIVPQPHHTEPADLAAPLVPGRTAPGFTLPDTAGDLVSLAPGASAATVVVFTCNACPWALGWHERLQSVARDYASKGVGVLHVNANDPKASSNDALEVSARRVANGEFVGPYLVDEGQRVARAWGARHTPDVFVLTADGVVAYHGAPDNEVDDDTQNAAWLRSALDDVLSGRPVELAQTEPTGCTIKWTL